VLYTALYMPATRTQVYLSSEQRAKIDAVRAREGKTLAEIVREALDAYLTEEPEDPREVLRATFGSLPDLEVPSRDEWDRG
jgi:hypothetical protein